MKYGIMGTGVVGRTLAEKLASLGHEVMIGTRDVTATLARTEPDGRGNAPFRTWQAEHSQVQLGTFAEAATHGEVLLNTTAGDISLSVFESIGKDILTGKILIDSANPLDFSHGMPPSLAIVNTDSLGEQIQRAFPALKVVKALNTVVVELMVNPRQIADGDHDLFICGNDAEAKAQVTTLLTEGFGWRRVIDLGDITAARGTEMLMPLNFRLWSVRQTRLLNFKLVQ